MSPITYEEAFAATNPDPKAYGLPEDASTDDVEKRRNDAATNIMAGVAANDAYWDSRSRLEALEAQAQGHGSAPPPPTEDKPPAGTIDATAEEERTQLPPSPDNPTEAVAKLRAQLEAAGIHPEA